MASDPTFDYLMNTFGLYGGDLECLFHPTMSPCHYDATGHQICEALGFDTTSISNSLDQLPNTGISPFNLHSGDNVHLSSDLVGSIFSSICLPATSLEDVLPSWVENGNPKPTGAPVLEQLESSLGVSNTSLDANGQVNLGISQFNADPAPRADPSSPLTHPLLEENFLSSSETSQWQLLHTILFSTWLRDDTLEPHTKPQGSIYLGFLRHSKEDGTYKCLFNGCNMLYNRRDRALGHVRQHVKHTPFPCNSKCGRPGCRRRFCSKPYLRTHTTRKEVSCSICGTMCSSQNMPRHVRSHHLK